MATKAKHHTNTPTPHPFLHSLIERSEQIHHRVHEIVNYSEFYYKKMRLIGSRTYTRAVQVPKMPFGLVELMEGLTRDVLKNNPPDIYEFCAEHMHKLLEIRDGPTKKITLEQKIARAQKKVKQKAEARYLKYLKRVQNSNSYGGKFNNKTETQPNSQKTSMAPPTPPLQPLLKPPVYQDLNISNASEIEISHESDDVISSSSNIHNKTEITDDVTSENISKEKVHKTNYAVIEKSVTTFNKISCDTKGETDDSSYLSSNSKNLISKIENAGEQVNEVQVSYITSDKELLKNQAVEDSTDSKNSHYNDNAQSYGDYNVTKVVEANLNINCESSETETKNEIELHGLLKENNKEIACEVTNTATKNEENYTELNLENIQNYNDNIDTELVKTIDNAVNKEVIDEHVNQTHLKESSSIDLQELKTEKENIETANESNLENINETIQLPVVLDKNNEILKHNGPNNLVRTDIIDDLKTELLHQEHTDVTVQNVQTGGDKSDENRFENIISDKIGETSFSIMKKHTIDDKNNAVQEKNVVRSVKDQLSTETPNILLKENEDKILTKELNLENTVEIKNDGESEVNTEEKIIKENNDEVNKTEEPENSKSDIHNNQSNETSQEALNKQLGLSQNIELVNNNDLSSENSVAKKNETEQFNNEYESTANTEKNDMNLKIKDKDQQEDKHQLTSLTEENIMNLNAEENEQHRVKRNITEPGYNHNDETIFSKKSVSGDESTDGNDNTSFIESGASETFDDTSQRTNPNTNAMDLETAAVTIQKVFRTFLFKSRASTFDDTNDENMPLDDDNDKKEENEFQASNVNIVKERRGISRMDTVLQTVNEEKSLSLSTDDSSTLSSAATTIQAHVRGFLVRNKLQSQKNASINSLVNSDGPSNTSLEGDTEINKNKTILNIHIVPEGGNYFSREESMLTSMDLSLDGSPPSSLNLHPLGYDRNERRKQLKREDAIQSISPPSNNSGKLSEDVDSIKDLLITDGEVTANQKNSNINKLNSSDDPQLLPESGDTSLTNSTTIETVVEAHKVVDLESSEPKIEVQSPEPKMEVQVKSTKRTLTKMSSDEMDVVTPFGSNAENESAREIHDAKLMHSGEFHDTVLPTKVSRKDTSVVSEFKNVLVYFLLWNNS